MQGILGEQSGPADALAVIVVVPEAPGTHWNVAVPVPVPTRVAKAGSTNHWPEYGATNVTGAGDGGRLKMPVAVNCTWPLVKFCASAVAGATVINSRARTGSFEVPQPVVCKARSRFPRRNVARRTGLRLAIRPPFSFEKIAQGRALVKCHCNLRLDCQARQLSLLSVGSDQLFLCLVIPSRPEPEARTSEESAVLLLQTQTLA